MIHTLCCIWERYTHIQSVKTINTCGVQLCNEMPTKSSIKDVRCCGGYKELHNT